MPVKFMDINRQVNCAIINPESLLLSLYPEYQCTYKCVKESVRHNLFSELLLWYYNLYLCVIRMFPVN
jgi:hypothetical protein